MFEVLITPDAQRQFISLPAPIQERVRRVFHRLALWPEVSGARPLRFELKGAFRVRTGDWRVLFTADEAGKRITVFRIDNRRDVYEQ